MLNVCLLDSFDSVSGMSPDSGGGMSPAAIENHILAAPMWLFLIIIGLVCVPWGALDAVEHSFAHIPKGVIKHRITCKRRYRTQNNLQNALSNTE